MRKRTKGLFLASLSGLLWSLYIVGVFRFSGVYNITLSKSITFDLILLVALTLLMIDALISTLTQVGVNAKSSSFNTLLYKIKIVPKSVTLLAMITGLGAIPYVLSNSINSSLTSVISSTYPIIGLIILVIFFKTRANYRTSIGIVLAALGVALNSVYSVTSVESKVILLSLIVSLSYALDSVVCSRLVKSDTDPSVLLIVKNLWLILLYLSIIIIILLNGHSLTEYSLLLTNAFIKPNSMLILITSSILGSLSYYVWYSSMKYLRYSTSTTLNMSYAIWIYVINSIIDNHLPYTTEMLSSLIILVGVIIVVKFVGDNYA